MFEKNDCPKCLIDERTAKRDPTLAMYMTEPSFAIATNVKEEELGAPKRRLEVTFTSDMGEDLSLEDVYHAYLQKLDDDDDDEEEVADETNDEEEDEDAANEDEYDAEDATEVVVIRPEDYFLTGVEFRAQTISLVYEARNGIIVGEQAFVPYGVFFDPYVAKDQLRIRVDVVESDEIVEVYEIVLGYDEEGAGVAFVDFTGHEGDPEAPLTEGSFSFAVDPDYGCEENLCEK